MTYHIKVAQFEGPFDLILFFIERDEVDIYDIPISKLTNDFLDYIRQMEQMNIDLASEFILVAATLMRIKAKMLLPRKELNEQGEEIDPRDELVAKLIEYKKFKAVLKDLYDLAEQRQMMHIRGDVKMETREIYDTFETEMDLGALDLYKVMKVFNRVLDKMEKRETAAKIEHKVEVYPYTIRQQKDIILRVCPVQGWIHFDEFFESCNEKMEAIFRFLALLEMIQLQAIKLRLDEGFNNLWVQRDENAVKIMEDSTRVDMYEYDNDKNQLGGSEEE